MGEKEGANPRGGAGNRGNRGRLCGCGEIRDEEMIECAVGKKCGGWVHYSCAGIEMGSHQESDEPFICRWCRAEGVNLQEARREKEEREKEKEREKERAMQEKEEEKLTMRLRSRKKETDAGYYGGYRHEGESDEENHPRRKRGRSGGDVGGSEVLGVRSCESREHFGRG